MKKENLSLLYETALKQKFALGAFNFVNMEGAQAIAIAAKEKNSPVILSCSEGAIQYMGLPYVMHLASAAKESAGVPVVLHLDHGSSFEVCKMAIDAGFDSVMIDASHLPLEENIKLTKQVVEYAKPFGVAVEGELGRLSGVEDHIHVSKEQSFYTDPLEAKRFVEETGVTCLAIAIGTSHGAFKFSGEPRLAFDVLKQIEALLPSTPLVLHGASSIDEEDVKLLNQYGGEMEGAKGVSASILKQVSSLHNVCKINVDSDLRIAFTAALRKTLQENKKQFDVRKILSPSKALMQQRIMEKMELFGSVQKA